MGVFAAVVAGCPALHAASCATAVLPTPTRPPLLQALLRGSMRKAFSGFDLLMLGLGITIASGWSQLSGYAAQQFAGPAVVVSYVFSGLAALLAACCFSDLCQ